jgi:hypothetical protein
MKKSRRRIASPKALITAGIYGRTNVVQTSSCTAAILKAACLKWVTIDKLKVSITGPLLGWIVTNALRQSG